MADLRARGLRPVRELAAAKPHGTRLRYLAGCKCQPCKTANTQYEIQRARARKAGDSNGIVDAAPAREHIRKLGRAGVGYKMVAESARVPVSTVLGIKSGKRAHARAFTVRRILAVTIECRGDAALVSGASTWQRIDALLEEGYTKKDLARRLGYKSRAIQFKRVKVTVRTRARVEKLFERLMT